MQTVCDGVVTDEVPGWFDWQDYYDRIVDSAPDGSTIVEVGVFLGKSLIYLVQRMKESGKRLRIIGVDTFQGSPEFEGRVFFNDQPWHQTPFGMLARECMACLRNHDALDDVTLIVSDSTKAAEIFTDGSVYAVFLDGDHAEPALIADIRAWLPKVQSGGTIGGHDYWSFPEVKAAVDYMLPGAVKNPDKSWWEDWIP